MSGFDGNGPQGDGPKTGRGLGKCDDDKGTAQDNTPQPGIGRGGEPRGGGRGRCRGGGGRGQGRGGRGRGNR